MGDIPQEVGFVPGILLPSVVEAVDARFQGLNHWWRRLTRRPACRPGRHAHSALVSLVLAVASGSWAATPVIDSFTASPSVVAPGATVTLEVTAHDPDCLSTCSTGCGQYLREDLTAWSASGGTFLAENNGTSGSPYVATADWSAPTVEGTFTVSVYLADSGSFLCGGRQSTTAQLSILVTTSSNLPPTIQSATADPVSLFPGEISQLRCTATDPDGDTVTVEWNTDVGIVIPGVDGNATLSSPLPGLATVTCTASDPLGAVDSATAQISISDVRAERMLRDGLGAPFRVAVDSLGDVFVADRSGGGLTVQRLEDGGLLYRLAVADVTAVAVDWADRLLVGGADGARLIDRAGTLLLDLRQVDAPADVADVAVDLVRQRYAVLHRGAGRVVVFDSNGVEISSFGSTGDGPGQLKSPSGLGVAPDGSLVVADSGHGSIKVFDLAGNLLLAFGELGSGVGKFVQLDDVEVDDNGIFYACDAFQDWVQTFNPDGSPREIIGTHGDGVGRFKTPAGVYPVPAFGRLLVTSVNSSSVQVFRLQEPGPALWPTAVGLTTPSQIAFPNQMVGTIGSPIRFDIFNSGDAPLGIHNLQVSGPFVLTHDCGPALDPATSCGVDVVFLPPGPGAHAGSVQVHTSAGPEPLAVALSGIGILPAQLLIEPGELDFSDQAVGTNSAARRLVATNPGTESLQIFGIDISGDYDATSTCSSILQGGSSCTIDVVFMPTVPGDSLVGTVTVQSDAVNGSTPVFLDGRAVSFELTPAPSDIFFPFVPVGEQSEQRLTVENTGTDVVTVDWLQLVGSDAGEFSLSSDNCSGVALHVGSSCTVDVVFAPTNPGEPSVVLEIVSNRDLSYAVPILVIREPTVFSDDFERGDLSAWSSVEGLAALDVAPSSLRFGGVLLGATAPEQPVFVTNRSRAGLSLGLIGMVGDQAQSFLILGDRCSGTFLEPEEGCAFSVILLTMDEGEFQVQVQIPNYANGDGGLVEIAVEGAVLWPGGTP